MILKIINSNPLFLLTRISKKTRMFIAGSFIACYGLFLYELLPEYLFNTSYSLYYFVFPIISIVGILVIMPKVMAREKPGTSNQDPIQMETFQEQAPEMTSFEAPKQESGMILDNKGGEGGIISDIILPSPGQTSDLTTNQSNVQHPAIAQQPIVDENVLANLVANAVEPFQRELARMQDIVSDVRSEINAVKSNVQELTSTFETSLTDLKAFQAEIANPLNFMRKYFDSIDIKNLSDPTLPLYAEQSPMQQVHSSNSETRYSKKESNLEEIHPVQSSKEESVKTTSPKQDESKHDEDKHEMEIHENLPFKQLFSGGITLGKLMNTTTVLEEILQTIDRDSIDMLIEQCKLMGLKHEDEHVIYNIINMMDQSGLSVKEILVMLYKFGKVMGISDKEADLVYAKLMMNQGKTPGTLVTVESKGS